MYLARFTWTESEVNGLKCVLNHRLSPTGIHDVAGMRKVWLAIPPFCITCLCDSGPVTRRATRQCRALPLAHLVFTERPRTSAFQRLFMSLREPRCIANPSGIFALPRNTRPCSGKIARFLPPETLPSGTAHRSWGRLVSPARDVPVREPPIAHFDPPCRGRLLVMETASADAEARQRSPGKASVVPVTCNRHL